MEGNTELDPTSTGGSSIIKDPQLEYLSEIVRDFNEKFGKDMAENDSIRKFMMEELPQKVVEKEEYQNTKSHSDRQNAKIAFKRIMQEVFQDYMFDQFDMYQKFTENEEFREWYTDKMFEMDYRFDGNNPL
ncbi:hypothetical protein F9U64_01730 [Gracilibacillus oryzae]|uniref:Uncharacterized protein n=1 Tax=Gracilibacillus oryzae TaxID=1672701 RepID=A0A7C8L9N2_9BACI|nr:hypothetical protein [Gracilibacillus oryzae]KAB8139137.1 hypothetical protein F9U64_01730 [Gracilibacillus oryzae]